MMVWALSFFQSASSPPMIRTPGSFSTIWWKPSRRSWAAAVAMPPQIS